MSEAPTRAATNGTGHDDDSGDGSSLLDALPTDRLREAAQALLKAATDKAVSAALEQVEGLTGRLTDVAENGGVGLTSAFGNGGEQESGGITGALKAGASTVKDKVTGALGMGGDDDGDGDGDAEGDGSGGSGGGGGGSRGKFKFMNIYETQDVGVPIRVAYDQWTQFADFPTFMKKLETVNQESDEKSTWTAKVFWSRRSWDTTIREQVPDSHILWVSSGAKGHADGFVSFHELAPNMTRIILILEYYPQGFFEKTGNLWRAVGRRARLEFKHFCRYVMMDTLINRDDLEGWRGEIRDSEVVKTHEEAIEEEQRAAAEDEDADDVDDADEGFDDEAPDEDDVDGEDELPDDAEDLDEDLDDGDELPDDVDDVDDADDLDDADEVEGIEDADDDEGRQGSRRRQRANA